PLRTGEELENPSGRDVVTLRSRSNSSNGRARAVPRESNLQSSPVSDGKRGMQPGLTSLQIALRLLLTAVAAGILGADRTQRGRVAGMRTTMLVGLAAAVAMILANQLLTLRGR